MVVPSVNALLVIFITILSPNTSPPKPNSSTLRKRKISGIQDAESPVSGRPSPRMADGRCHAGAGQGSRNREWTRMDANFDRKRTDETEGENEEEFRGKLRTIWTVVFPERQA